MIPGSHLWRLPNCCLQATPKSLVGSLAFGLGELAEGRPADLAILDYQPPTPLTAENFLGHLIFGLVDAVVDTTVCRGRILMRGKKVLSLDEERIAARSRELAPVMWKRLQAAA